MTFTPDQVDPALRRPRRASAPPCSWARRVRPRGAARARGARPGDGPATAGRRARRGDGRAAAGARRAEPVAVRLRLVHAHVQHAAAAGDAPGRGRRRWRRSLSRSAASSWRGAGPVGVAGQRGGRGGGTCRRRPSGRPARTALWGSPPRPPLAVVLVAVLALQVLSLVRIAAAHPDGYTPTADAVATAAGDPCGLQSRAARRDRPGRGRLTPRRGRPAARRARPGRPPASRPSTSAAPRSPASSSTDTGVDRLVRPRPPLRAASCPSSSPRVGTLGRPATTSARPTSRRTQMTRRRRLAEQPTAPVDRAGARPAGADAVRLAVDRPPAATAAVVAPPRAPAHPHDRCCPRGTRAILDWPVAFVFPCLDPRAAAAGDRGPPDVAGGAAGVRPGGGHHLQRPGSAARSRGRGCWSRSSGCRPTCAATRPRRAPALPLGPDRRRCGRCSPRCGSAHVVAPFADTSAVLRLIGGVRSPGARPERGMSENEVPRPPTAGRPHRMAARPQSTDTVDTPAAEPSRTGRSRRQTDLDGATGPDAVAMIAQRGLFSGPRLLVPEDLYARVERGAASRERDRVVLDPHSPSAPTPTSAGSRPPTGSAGRPCGEVEVDRAGHRDRTRPADGLGPNKGGARRRAEESRTPTATCGWSRTSTGSSTAAAMWLELDDRDRRDHRRGRALDRRRTLPGGRTAVVICTYNRADDCLDDPADAGRDRRSLAGVDAVYVVDQGTDRVETRAEVRGGRERARRQAALHPPAQPRRCRRLHPGIYEVAGRRPDDRQRAVHGRRHPARAGDRHPAARRSPTATADADDRRRRRCSTSCTRISCTSAPSTADLGTLRAGSPVDGRAARRRRRRERTAGAAGSTRRTTAGGRA